VGDLFPNQRVGLGFAAGHGDYPAALGTFHLFAG